MHDRLQTTLRQLRLSGLSQTLDVRLQEAAGHQLSHAEFLELILQDELAVRDERQIGRRIKTAAFRELKPLDEFDWAFNPSLPRRQSLRPGHPPLRAGTSRRADHRAAGNRQELRGPSWSDGKPSSWASWCSIARSSTWYATSSTRTLWERRTGSWPAT